MVLKHLLSQNRIAILERWLCLTIETYPADASRFLKQENDRFINPVGYTMSQEMEALYEELLQEMNPDKLGASLDSIIRIRSVQDFAPSQAVAFIFLLKEAIREELASEIRENRIFKELLQFESRVDKLALLALDIYMKCREKVYELRVNEIKAERELALRLWERTNLSTESQTRQGLKDGEI